ncbi:MAG: hypothetical protein Q3993_03780 [Filifactor alocis]|nr:hypothetical protein [Filifactor alocis]
MLKKVAFFVLSIFLITGMSTYAIGINEERVGISEEVYDESFFEELRMTVVREELAMQGIQPERNLSFDEVLTSLQSSSVQVPQKTQLMKEIQSLHDAEYIHMTLNGDIYSSKEGYIGKAEETPISYDEPSEMELEELRVKSSQEIQPMAASPSQVYGGTTGAFKREQLKFEGFDGIIADIKLPKVSNIPLKPDGTSYEQAWVYYGFDSEHWKKGVEGGFAFQTGSNHWKGYIKFKSGDDGFEYENSKGKFFIIPNNGTTVKNYKFYLKNVNGKVKAFLVIAGGSPVVASTATPFVPQDLEKMSVKRVTSIAKDNFNGSNIQTRSRNQKFINTMVSKHDSWKYASWPDSDTYSEVFQGKIRGTVICTDNYIHVKNHETSIYK